MQIQALLAVFLHLVPSTLASNIYFQTNSQAGDDNGVGAYSGFTDNSHEYGACGCNFVPADVPTICAHVHMEGQRVDCYSSSDCSSGWLIGWTGTGEVYTCGSSTYEVQSCHITC